jgi:hypothetical protein
MQIEEIEKMWVDDAIIDEADLSREAAKIPKLHAKYYQMYFRAVMKSNKLKSDLKILEKDKSLFYSGKMAQEDLKERGWLPFGHGPIIRADMDKYIQADQDIIDLSLRIDYFEGMAKFLEDVIRQINNRNFVIKNMIDWIRFQAGSN